MDPQAQANQAPQASQAQQAAVDPVKDLEELTKDPVPTLAQDVAQFEASHGGKEAEPAYAEATAGKPAESANEIEEIPEQPDTKEVAGYMEQVERAAESQQTVTDDYTNQVLMAPANPQNVVVTLPMTADDIKKGLHHQIMDGVRWLAEWCVRQIKVLHGRVRFKNTKT